MISVHEAKQLVLQHVKPLPPKSIAVKDAAGLTLAARVVAVTDIPGYAQSNVDGYAFIFEDAALPLTITGEMAAGTNNNLPIGRAQAARIFTGAPVPTGADTIVMQEKTTLGNGQLLMTEPPLQRGENIRLKGAEIKAGQPAMPIHTPLTVAALGFLSGIGISNVNIYPAPVVSLIITGKELQQPGLPLAFGQVYDANSTMLHTALQYAGIKDIRLLYADDDLQTVTQLLATALLQSDMVLLAGGISVGDYDFVLPAAMQCGVQQHFHKVKQKPGKPLFFGTKGHKAVFGLPGNPSSALTCFFEYVLPAIGNMMHKQTAPATQEAILLHGFKKPKGLTHFLKGSYANGHVQLLGAQESFRLATYAQANCLVVFDEDREVFAAGETITIHHLPF